MMVFDPAYYKQGSCRNRRSRDSEVTLALMEGISRLQCIDPYHGSFFRSVSNLTRFGDAC